MYSLQEEGSLGRELLGPARQASGVVATIAAVPPPQPHQLLRIPIKFTDSCSCYSLIDGGAASSFISAQLLATLDQHCIKEHEDSYLWPAFTTASGGPLKTYGCFNISFHLENLEFHHDFYVLAHLEENCILGADFQNTREAIVDFKKKTLSQKLTHST